MASKQKWTVEYISKVIDDLLIWLKPNYKEDKEGNMIDVNQKNYFYGKYLVEEYDINPENFYNNIQIYPWLSDKYEKMRKYEEFKLASLGLDRKIDSALTKFTLSSRHDWKEKSEVDNNNTHKIKDFDIREIVGFKNKEKKKK